ncbi:hypothetical protein, partial [Acidovorax soli]|uniref:hypothetical protein n=1 Tax=Acidovorax soli TaxID=592050 RepID=UPI0032B30591
MARQDCRPSAALHPATTRPAGAHRQALCFESLFTISQGIALERNRDEWMLRVRRMGSCPCKR